MKRVTLREYSKLHKLSFFNVLKMVKNGDVKTEIIAENGKEIEYILLETEQEEMVKKNILETTKQKLSLEEENKLLKLEIKRLKEALEKCNQRTILA